MINEYENGKAIPNQQIMTKLERLLEVKLRGKVSSSSDSPASALIPLFPTF